MRVRSVALVVALLVLGAPAWAGAAWSATAAGVVSTASDTMTNATSFTAACTNKSANSTITLNWTISPDVYVTGYLVQRTDTAGLTNLIPVPGRTTASYVDTGTQVNGFVYTYEIRAVADASAWTTAWLRATGTPGYTGNRGACVTGT